VKSVGARPRGRKGEGVWCEEQKAGVESVCVGLSVTVGASFRIGSSATGFCGGHVITPNSTLAIAIAIAITTTVMSAVLQYNTIQHQQHLPHQAMPP
jgi:hypothetical protein